MHTTIHRSVCPYDCPDTCGLLVHVQNGKAIKVTGDPEHPYTRGTLCPKMNRYQDTVHSSRRLTMPLERCGPKGSGAFRAVSWEKAVATIADRWRSVIEMHGSEAILPYSFAGTMGLLQRNAGHAFFHRLGASRLARTICAPAKDDGWKTVMGNTPGVRPEAVANSDVIVLWGVNAAATSIHFLKDVRIARRRGAKIWLIETYQTPTAAMAQRTILVKPGTDAALALGVMHQLVNRNRCDRDFIKTHVQGFNRLNAKVLPSYGPDAVRDITGVDGDTLTALTDDLATAKRPFIHIGSGLSRYGNGALTVRTIVALPALLGAYAKPGCGAFTGVSTGAAFDLAPVVRKDLIRGNPRIINMNQLGRALNTLDQPPIASLYVYQANPAAVVPDQNQVLKGLARDDLFTIVHERFMTDTAAYADIVLPAASSLETADIYRSYGHYCTQRSWPVIDPVGQSKSNWAVFRLLAHAMGFENTVFKQSDEAMIAQILDRPTDMQASMDRPAFDKGMAVALDPGQTFGRFGTPSGKIELYNSAIEPPLPAYRAPHGGDAPFCLMTAPTPYALNSSFYERASLRRKQNGMLLKIHPDAAARLGLAHGQQVVAFNDCGEVTFGLCATPKVPMGVAVAEGVWWLEFAPGARTVNALTSQRLTDRGRGSTFYDNRIHIRAA